MEMLSTDFHLALAIPELLQDETYREALSFAKTAGDFIVLDNGAAEGVMAQPHELDAIAEEIEADEVVLPDVMRDSLQTIKAVADFMYYYAERPSYMAVVQGKNFEELMHCAETFAEHKQIKTLGIPRHLLTTMQSRTARIDTVFKLSEVYGERFEFHMLGTNPQWIEETYYIAKYHPYVRSVDTSAPWNYAIAHRNVNGGQETWRPKQYFEWNWAQRVTAKQVSANLIKRNVRTFKRWASGTKASS